MLLAFAKIRIPTNHQNSLKIKVKVFTTPPRDIRSLILCFTKIYYMHVAKLDQQEQDLCLFDGVLQKHDGAINLDTVRESGWDKTGGLTRFNCCCQRLRWRDFLRVAPQHMHQAGPTAPQHMHQAPSRAHCTSTYTSSTRAHCTTINAPDCQRSELKAEHMLDGRCHVGDDRDCGAAVNFKQHGVLCLGGFTKY